MNKKTTLVVLLALSLIFPHQAFAKGLHFGIISAIEEKIDELREKKRIEATGGIGPEGGTVEVIDPSSPLYGIKVEVPPGALSSKTNIRISRASTTPSIPRDSLKRIGEPAELLPAKLIFNEPITISFPYDSSINEEQQVVIIGAYDEESLSWDVPAFIGLDTDNDIVKIQTKSFSIFDRFSIDVTTVQSESSSLVSSASSAAFTDFDFSKDIFPIENSPSAGLQQGACWGIGGYTRWYYEHKRPIQQALRKGYDRDFARDVAQDAQDVQKDTMATVEYIASLFYQRWVGHWILAGMDLTRMPQMVMVITPLIKEGHCILAFDYRWPYFYIYDVNYIDDYKKIWFDQIYFKPYSGYLCYVNLGKVYLKESAMEEIYNRYLKIMVRKPDAGDEIWPVGEKRNITWSFGPVGTRVKLEYSTDSGSSWSTITDSHPNDGDYSWTVPNTPSTHCRVKVTSTSNSSYTDMSDNDFTISSTGERVSVDVETKCWEDQPYQLRIEAYATPLDVSSITISGPHIDTATVHTGGGNPHHLYDDGNHTDDQANDGIWRVELNIVGTPAEGETIIFDIVYNDGSSETKQKSIDGVLSETAQLFSPPDGSTVNTLTPTFVWSNPSVSGLTYSVQVSDTNHNRVYDVYDLPDGTTSHTIPSGYLNWGTTYYWLVSASDANGNEALTKWDTFTTSGTAASTTTAIGQPKFSLSQDYPNPLNPETTIEYGLAQSCHVTLKIYNLSGQLIKTLIDEYQQAGSHKITWYGDNDAGQEVASSVYFYRIKAGDFGSTKKMIVLK